MIEKMTWSEAQKNLDKGVVYLEFTTEWCGDCKMMKPVVEKVAAHFKDEKNFRLIQVDAEEAKLFRNSDSKWQVLKVPTHTILNNGIIKLRHFEYASFVQIVSWIENELKFC